MVQKQDLPGPKLTAWPLALLGVAVCLLGLVGIWVHDASAPANPQRIADVRQRELARSRLADEQGSSPVDPGGLPRAPASLPDAAPWIPEEEAVATLELDFQMVAGLSSDLAGASERLPNVGLQSPSGQRSNQAALELRARQASAPDSDPMASVDPGRASRASAETMDAGARAAASLDALERVAASGALDEGAGSMLGAPVAPPGERCGLVTCPAGGVCCNESCGTCVLPGETCSRLSCSLPRYPISIPCGRNTCAVGEICCNASCGTCTLPDETCAQAICD